MLNILLLTTSYPMHSASISGIFIKKLAHGLMERCCVTVLAPASSIPINKKAKNKELIIGCRYAPQMFQTLAHNPGGIPVKIRKNPFFIALIPMLVVSMMFNTLWYARKCDLVFCNWAVTGFIAVLMKKIIHKPIVVTLRGEDVNINGKGLRYSLVKACLKHCDRVVLVSDEMKNELSLMFPQYVSKMQIVHNGIDQLFLKARASAPKRSEVIRFVSVGSLIPRKNHLQLLKAMVTLKQKGMLFEFHLIGNGEKNKEIKQYIHKNGLDENVRIHGSLSHADIVKVLSCSHVFVTASKHEGRPNAVIEAMAVGLAVLASNISGHKELVRESHCGELFELSNEESLTSKMEALIQDREMVKKYGLNAKHYSLKSNHTWDGCAESYMRIFRKLVAS